MKRLLMFVALTFILLDCDAQNTSKSQSLKYYKLIDAGVAMINNGSVVISLDTKVPANDYFIILTPIGEFNEIYIGEKLDQSFTVKSKTNKQIEFQYVVVLQKTKEKEINDNNKKNN